MSALKKLIDSKPGVGQTFYIKQLDSELLPSELTPPLQFRLLTVSCPQTLTSDGESLNSDALCSVSPDHLVCAEFI